MRYWNDFYMDDGFECGKKIPDGVQIYRYLYLKAMNKYAKRYKSGLNALALDLNLPDINPYRIIFLSHYDLPYMKIPNTDHVIKDDAGRVYRELLPDSGMMKAIQACLDMQLDFYVKSLFEIDESFYDWLNMDPKEERSITIRSSNLEKSKRKMKRELLFE